MSKKDYVNESNFTEFRQAVKQSVLSGADSITFNGYTQTVPQAETVVDFLTSWYQRWDDDSNPKKGNEYYESWKKNQKELKQRCIGRGAPAAPEEALLDEKSVAKKGEIDGKETTDHERQPESFVEHECPVRTDGQSIKTGSNSKKSGRKRSKRKNRISG